MKLICVLFTTCLAITAGACATEPDPGITGDDITDIPQGLVYEVPVPQDLEQWALFPMTEARLRVKDGEVDLEYPLPLALTGYPAVHVELEGYDPGAGATFALSGSLGDATCEAVADDSYRCHVTYPELTIDEAAVRAYIAEAYPGVERDQRTAVAEVFSVDPIGFVHGLTLEVR